MTRYYGHDTGSIYRVITDRIDHNGQPIPYTKSVLGPYTTAAAARAQATRHEGLVELDGHRRRARIQAAWIGDWTEADR